jgi:hypothetical protein
VGFLLAIASKKPAAELERTLLKDAAPFDFQGCGF